MLRRETPWPNYLSEECSKGDPPGPSGAGRAPESDRAEISLCSPLFRERPQPGEESDYGEAPSQEEEATRFGDRLGRADGALGAERDVVESDLVGRPGKVHGMGDPIEGHAKGEERAESPGRIRRALE